MAINPHHTIEEVNGTSCSVIEKGISADRAAFLKEILESSGQSVIQSSDAEGKVTLGVTNLAFNVLYALYGGRLKNLKGELVTPSYWYTMKTNEGFYWEYKV